MILKPQDILVLLKLVAIGKQKWTYAGLGVDLGMSVSQLHSSIKRAMVAGLAYKKDDDILPNIRNLEEFLVHGVRYVFVPERGELTRGMLTGYAAPPLVNHFVQSDEPPPVWPDPEGDAKGIAFSPLYKLAPGAAKNDDALYELLVLVDAIRGGRAREIDLANKELKRRLKAYD